MEAAMTSEHKSSSIAQQLHDAGTAAGALRALPTLAAANHELVRASSEPAFLQAVCEAAVKKGGYLRAWIGVAEYGEDKAVRPVAQCGYEEGHLASAGITWANTERGQDPAGRAIRTCESQVVRNVPADSPTSQQNGGAPERAVRASIALPLKRNFGAFGALTICAREPEAFGRAEAALLEELAADLAFGIITLRAKAARERGAEQIHQYQLRIRRRVDETIEAVCAELKAHDAYTYGHQKRVAALALVIAKELGLSENEVQAVNVAALVHDIGNLKVPGEILAKTGALNQVEFALVQEHAETGRNMLKDITFPWAVADIVWQHHERLDGSGYPRGLRGDEILLEARILSVADVVEAMASDRPYRPVLSMDLAMEEISRGRGVSFDAAVVDACVRLCHESRFVFPRVAQ
jgi:putative nucleotidyltransferase with HDIG domain